MSSHKRAWLILIALTATAAFAFTLSRTGTLVVERAAALEASTAPQMAASAQLQAGATASSVQWPASARVRFGEWISIASDNLASGVRSVTASGGLLYALGDVGSIYVSADGAATWQQVAHVRQKDDFLLPMAKLVVLPAQGTRPLTFFATGASSWPTFYRVREGDTQVIVPGHPLRDDDTSVRRVAIAGDTVYVSTDTGIFRSDDAGDTWQLALQTDTDSWCSALVASGNTVYARCDSYGPVNGVFRSVNGGAFSRMSNDTALKWTDLAVSPSNPNVLYAFGPEAVMRSVDGAATWTKTIDRYNDPDPMNRAVGASLETVCLYGSADNYGAGLAVDPVNPNVVWIGRGELYRSDDGAAHFGRASVPGTVGADPQVLPEAISQLVFRGNALHVVTESGGVYGTANRHDAVQAGGPGACTNPGTPPQIAWAAENTGINGQQFIEVAVSGDDSVLATTQSETLHYSDLDNPGSWLPMPAPPTRAIVVDPAGGIDRFYATGCGGNACRWDIDAGSGIWQKTNAGQFGFGGMGLLVMDPSDRNRVWTAIGGSIYRSDDGLASGVHLGYASGCQLSAGAVSPTDPNILVLASGWCGGVTRKGNALSLSGEVDWSVQRVRPDDWTVNEVAFDRVNTQRVFMIGNKAPSIYASPDTGVTWSALDAIGAQDGLPDSDVRTFVIDPELGEVIYIGGTAGLFVNWNLGSAGPQTWHEVPTPFRGAAIQKLAIRKLPDGTRRLFVYTQGAGVWTTTIEVARFGDVVFDDWSYDYVNRLFAAGITTGCSTAPIAYCPQQPVLREQMAAFLLRALHGGNYQPPARAGSFADVPAQHWAVNWIEQLRVEGITNGCATDPVRYCPDDVVPREQIAVFLLRAKHGASYQPPPAMGVFEDVPADSWAAAWIEQLAHEGIANGCSVSPARYCPADPVTREQMAALLVRAFNL